MQSFFLHHDPYPLPCVMLHAPSSDEAVLMFVTTYTENFQFLENWQRVQLLHILEHALKYPYRRPKGKVLLKELYVFAEACVGIWRSHKSYFSAPIVRPPSQELLNSIPKADHVVIPSEEQFRSMVDDLFLLGSASRVSK